MAYRTTLSVFLSGKNRKNSPNLNSRKASIVKKGNLSRKKITGLKSRFFVLRNKTSDLPAILEKYESEKKYNEGYQPTKKYTLKDYNIVRMTEKSHPYIIALYFNKNCIALVPDSERELHDWLRHLQLQKNSNLQDLYPNTSYEHVWQVNVLPKSVAVTEKLVGKHFLCLSNLFLSLVRVGDTSKKKDFQLNTIKSCANHDEFFLFFLGRYSGIGCGELYLQTEDPLIAQNIYQSVFSAMNNFSRRLKSESMMIPLRTSTCFDSQPYFSLNEKRSRSESVPTSSKRSLTKFPRHSLEIINQQQHNLTSTDGRTDPTLSPSSCPWSETSATYFRRISSKDRLWISENSIRRKKRTPESHSSCIGLDISNYTSDFNDRQLNCTQSLCETNKDANGYVPMNPPNYLSSSPTTISKLNKEKSKTIPCHIHETYSELSSFFSSCESDDDYVQMTPQMELSDAI